MRSVTFYVKTGLSTFLNDTIYKKHFFHKLSVSFAHHFHFPYITSHFNKKQMILFIKYEIRASLWDTYGIKIFRRPRKFKIIIEEHGQKDRRHGDLTSCNCAMPSPDMAFYRGSDQWASTREASRMLFLPSQALLETSFMLRQRVSWRHTLHASKTVQKANFLKNPSVKSVFPLTLYHAVKLYSKPLTEMSPKH